jgi:hypothetical protein
MTLLLTAFVTNKNIFGLLFNGYPHEGAWLVNLFVSFPFIWLGEQMYKEEQEQAQIIRNDEAKRTNDELLAQNHQSLPDSNTVENFLIKVKELKDKPIFLYLRPFNVDGKLRIPNPKKLPLSIDVGEFPEIDFELYLTELTEKIAPLIALGKENELIGTGKIATTDENWKKVFYRLASTASLVFVVPSLHAGTKFEIEWLIENKKLSKTLFFCMPSSNWIEIKNGLAIIGLHFPEKINKPTFFLFDETGGIGHKWSMKQVNRAVLSNLITSVHSSPTIFNSIMLHKAWNGEELLWKVFWIYGVAVSVLYGLIYEYSPDNGIDSLSILENILLAPYIIYTILWMVSLWRCAPNSDLSLWTWLARAIVAIMFPLMLSAMYSLAIDVYQQLVM